MQVFQSKDSSGSTWENSNIQRSQSFSLTKNMMMMSTTQLPSSMKHSSLQLQNQDSSSTQSTGESGGGEAASFGEPNRYGCNSIVANTNLSGQTNKLDLLRFYETAKLFFVGFLLVLIDVGYNKSTTTSSMVSQEPVFPPTCGPPSWPLQCAETSHFNGFLASEYASQPTVIYSIVLSFSKILYLSGVGCLYWEKFLCTAIAFGNDGFGYFKSAIAS